MQHDNPTGFNADGTDATSDGSERAAHGSPERATRRSFLHQVASVAGTAPLGAQVLASAGLAATLDPAIASSPGAPTAAESAALAAPATSPQPLPQDSSYESFSPDEAAFVEALVNVMCPADALTPSGVDCGLATYIDRQLAGAFGQGGRRYMQGPWRAGKPELGNQLPLTPVQLFQAGLAAAALQCTRRYGKSFDQLNSVDAAAFVEQLASGAVSDPRLALDRWFNDLVYPLFVQACFADPIYGGNRNKIFWKMLGYPGLPAVYARDIVDYRGKQHPAGLNPKSIADFS